MYSYMLISRKSDKQKRIVKQDRWVKGVLISYGLVLIVLAVLTIVVDPYFHYHKPLDGMKYRLYEQRYINDGISRNFEYNALITGNSLSENTKTSEYDALFGTTSIKIPYSGAGYSELWESIERALNYNPNIKRVLFFLDYEDIARDKDWVRYTEYPDYLYDDNFFNDAPYLWNKDTLYRGTLLNLLMTLTGKESTTFDEYSVWEAETGEEMVLPYLDADGTEPSDVEVIFDEGKQELVKENISDNILRVTEKYPEVRFDIIYTPGSIAKWYRYNRRSEVKYRLEAGEYATKLLLDGENVHVYDFMCEYEKICDLDNYHDTIHYTTDMNSYFLNRMAKGENELKPEMLEAYFNDLQQFYCNYDYAGLKEKANDGQ